MLHPILHKNIKIAVIIKCYTFYTYHFHSFILRFYHCPTFIRVISLLNNCIIVKFNIIFGKRDTINQNTFTNDNFKSTLSQSIRLCYGN